MICATTLSLSGPSEGQETVGYKTISNEFVTLNKTVDGWSGHITEYNTLEGFNHVPITGDFADNGSTLLLDIIDADLAVMPDLDTSVRVYSKTKVDKNTAYVPEVMFPGRLSSPLVGTTLKEDIKGTKFLRHYEINKSQRSIDIQRLALERKARSVFCASNPAMNDRHPLFCPQQNDGEIGVVVPQSQVGLWDIVASEYGQFNRVQTFSSDFDGAVVVMAPVVFDAFAEATGPDFIDQFVDASATVAIDQRSLALPDQAQHLTMVVNGQTFFNLIHNSPGATDDINSAMADFFVRFSGTEEQCAYSMSRGTPFFECRHHSDDFGQSREQMWVQSVLSIFTQEVDEDMLRVSFVMYFSRQYDPKSNPPSANEFDPITSPTNAERETRGSIIAALSNSLLTQFQDAVEIR